MQTTTDTTGSSLWRTYQNRMRPLAATIAVGATLGLLIGGVGGRLAMRLMFVTSDPSVRGIVSDDGFVIGQFTPATFVLLLLGTLAGVLGALLYVVLRPFLPGTPWKRWTSCALWSAAVIGTLLVHTDGVDFTLLSPRWLAIVLFVALPGLFGLVVGPAVEWAIRPDGWFHTASPWIALAPLLLLLIPGPPLFLLGIPIVVAIGLMHVVQRSTRLAQAFRHPSLLWSVRAVWVGIAVVAAADLGRKTAILL